MLQASLAAEKTELMLWTRVGPISGAWSAYDTFESLVFNVEIRTQIQRLALGLLEAKEFCAKARLPWRRGAFLYGAAGTGKTAATRAAAMLLGWSHVTIPAFEILDGHHLARALASIRKFAPAVVVFENIDEIFKRVDAPVVFDLLDQTSDATDGIFWVATTRIPEDVPKLQLVRPGRFEEVVRMTSPSNEAKRRYFETYVAPFITGEGKVEVLVALEGNPILTYSHLQELRLLVAKVLMDGQPEKIGQVCQVFLQELSISVDRSGGAAAPRLELEERIRLTDPRLLLSALSVTDAFKRVVELSVTATSDAIETLTNKS